MFFHGPPRRHCRARSAASCHAAWQPAAEDFFEDGDYALTRDLLAERCRKADVAVCAYCLMPNHVHLILVPAIADGLALALGEMHRRYTGFVNALLRVIGHLFQGRFGSVVLDEPHLVAAARQGLPRDYCHASANLKGRAPFSRLREKVSREA